MQIKKEESDDRSKMKNTSWKFWISSFYDSWAIHFRNLMFWNEMFWNESDHKKYDFVLVLYLSRDISCFKSEKCANIKLLHACFLY